MDRLFKTSNGKIMLSIVWGLGIAALFYAACKGGKCLVMKAPNGVKNHVYEFDKDCYKFEPYAVKCGSEGFCGNSATNSVAIPDYSDIVPTDPAAHFGGGDRQVASCRNKDWYRSPTCLSYDFHTAKLCGDPRFRAQAGCYKFNPTDTIFRAPSSQIYYPYTRN